jgi:tRNA(Ile2) C34 agmatinyltransferase TiaS
MSWLQFAVGAIVVIGAWNLVNRRYQRCPHCRKIVPRAVRGWLRCKGCGRQYHRSVMLKR